MEEAGLAILQAFPSRTVDRMLWGESVRSMRLCPTDEGRNAVGKPAAVALAAAIRYGFTMLPSARRTVSHAPP